MDEPRGRPGAPSPTDARTFLSMPPGVPAPTGSLPREPAACPPPPRPPTTWKQLESRLRTRPWVQCSPHLSSFRVRPKAAVVGTWATISRTPVLGPSRARLDHAPGPARAFQVKPRERSLGRQGPQQPEGLGPGGSGARARGQGPPLCPGSAVTAAHREGESRGGKQRFKDRPTLQGFPICTLYRLQPGRWGHSPAKGPNPKAFLSRPHLQPGCGHSPR